MTGGSPWGGAAGRSRPEEALMRIREPIVSGRFYPASPQACRAAVRQCLADPAADLPAGARMIGGIVPHAGWACSGRVAGQVFSALARGDKPDVLVLFGGVHRYRGREAALFGSGRWETPIGSAVIDERLGERILGLTNLIIDDPYAHENEHSLEVQIPFVIELFPEARVVPIMVPPNDRAAQVGEAVARTLDAYQYNALVVGTTDLTHYGPGYAFSPKGVGEAAHHWARENDRGFIERMCQLDAAALVAEAAAHHNACNAGAAAATIAAARSLGATSSALLEHTTSREVLGGESDDFVGYAGVVYW